MSFQNSIGVDASRSNFNDIRGNQNNYFRSHKPDINEILAPVPDAAYSRRGPVARCYPGTRENVISEIIRQVEKHGDHPICWLNGPAGYGKSAIAQAICERYAAQRKLAASFFFFRGAGNRSIIARLIPTISHQLSISVPSTKPFIQHIIESEPHITSQSLEYQFQKLVIEPLLKSPNPESAVQEQPLIPHQSRGSRSNNPRTGPAAWGGRSNLAPSSRTEPVTAVIVIDALDECNDKDQMADFIEIIIGAFMVNHGLPVRVLITSRVEEHIRQKLDTRAAMSIVHHLSLHDFDAGRDISTFFQCRFDAIYEENYRVMRNVSRPWPSKYDLRSLVEKSSGSFIFAVTLMDFICKGSGLPQLKLQRALTTEAGLDPLYIQVLSDAPFDHNSERVIGTVMLLSFPLSIMYLADLLQLQAEDIVQALLGMQSILMIPGDDDQAIQLFHTSLRDFLISKPRSNNFFIDPATHHISIAIDCLTVIAMQPQKGIFYGGVQVYACMNWCHHLHHSLVNGGDSILKSLLEASLTKAIKDFASQSHDFWVNTLLSQGYKKPLDALDLVLSMMTQSPICAQDSVQVLQDISKHAKLDIKDYLTWRYPAPAAMGDWAWPAPHPTHYIKKWRNSQLQNH